MLARPLCLALAITLLASTGARADHRIGNGGDAVVCPESVQLLDFYEASVRGIVVVLGAGTDPFALAAAAVQRVMRLDSDLGPRLAAWVADVRADAAFVPGATLTPIQDTNHRVLPAGCHLEQLANQHEPEVPNDKRYLVSADLWAKLGPLRPGRVVLHEVIYREALDHGQDDSVRARYLTALVASNSSTR